MTAIDDIHMLAVAQLDRWSAGQLELEPATLTALRTIANLSDTTDVTA